MFATVTRSPPHTGLGRYASAIARGLHSKFYFAQVNTEVPPGYDKVIKVFSVRPTLIIDTFLYDIFCKQVTEQNVFLPHIDFLNHAKHKIMVAGLQDLVFLKWVNLKYTTYMKFMLKHLHEAAYIILPSHFTLMELDGFLMKRKLDLPPYKVIYHGNYLPVRYTHEEASKRLRELYGIPENKRIILNVANAQPRKDLPRLRRIKEKLGDNYFLITVGKDNVYGDKSIGTITDDSLSMLYAGSDVYLSTSLEEGFELPLVEAAAHGLPAVVTDIPIHWELGKQLKLFPYETDEEAVERIKEAQEVRVTLPDYFRVERVLKEHEEVFRKVFVN
ncbi:MAG: glycosyltransferase [Metallosphaera sp.]